jgi:hypothetical protein
MPLDIFRFEILIQKILANFLFFVNFWGESKAFRYGMFTLDAFNFSFPSGVIL